MTRPTDWSPLDRSSDPTPGDPYNLHILARRMRDLGDEAQSAASQVRGLAGDQAAMTWIGASGDAFREHIGKFPGQLDKVANSHHMCGAALEEYANALDGAQSQADPRPVAGRTDPRPCQGTDLTAQHRRRRPHLGGEGP